VTLSNPSSPLIIDTLGPRVAHLQFVPKQHEIIVVLSDTGTGVDPTSATKLANYTIVPPLTIAGGSAQAVVPHPSIAGFYSSATAATVTFSLGKGARVPRGRYIFQISSGGVTDLAGNALDGEFSGRFPSGNGAPGGNFIAGLINNVAPPRAHRQGRAGHGGKMK
jgi:hypothetical protein